MHFNSGINLKNDYSIVYSIIVPVYNSEKTIPKLHKRLIKVMENINNSFEVIYVEDCGLDNAWGIVCELSKNDPRISAIQLMQNSGQGNATLAGFIYAKGAYIITMDDDLQHPPEELPKLINALLENKNIDVVIGAPAVKKHNMIRRLGSTFINRLNSLFLNKPVSLQFTGFRVMSRQVADMLLEMNVPYPALGPMIISITQRVKNIRVKHDYRQEGKSNYTFSRIVKQTLSNFVGYSMLPLRLLAHIGLVGIVFSVILGIYYIIRYLTSGIGVPGWTTLLLVLLALMGFSFFAFAIIGEYLLRIITIQMASKNFHVREHCCFHFDVTNDIK